MAAESAVIKTEDGDMPQPHMLEVVKEELNPDSEAAEVKLESEIILSDYDDEECLQESAEKKSPQRWTETHTATIIPGRTVRIVLTRCDVGEGAHFNSKQSGVPEVINENCSDAIATRVKVENEFESSETLGSGSWCARSDDLVRTVTGDDKLLDHHLETETFIKMEKKEVPSIREPVGYFPSSLQSSVCDKKPLLKIIKIEESKLQSDYHRHLTVGISSSGVAGECLEIFQPKDSILSKTHKVKNEFVLGSIVKTHNLGDDDTADTVVNESSNVLIRELVGHFPSSPQSINFDKKPLLKVVKLEENKLLSDLHCNSTIKNSSAGVAEKFPEISQPKDSILSEIQVENESVSESTVKTHKSGEDDIADTVVNAASNVSSQCSADIKMEEEEEEGTVESAAHNSSRNSLQYIPVVKIEGEAGPISKELVNILPKNLAQRENEEKSKLKISQSKERSAGVENEPESDAHPTIGPANAHNSKSFSVVLQPKNRNSSDVHPKMKSDVKSFSCSQCLYKCHRQSRMVEHLLVHSSERPFKCKYCPMKFKAKRHLNMHITTHTNETYFECNECGKRLKLKRSLIIHLRRHSDEMRYSCILCQAKFKTKADLKVHSIKHSTERRFECAHCSGKFKSKRVLIVHLRIHSSSSEWSYACEHCSAKFRCKADVASHLRNVHFNERPHSCPQCSKKFKQRSVMEVHLRCHTREMPYSCPQCHAKFSNLRNLRRHLKRHSVEKLFVCDQCPEKFKSDFRLKVHKKTHETTRLYWCVHCPKHFKTPKARSRHMKRIHIVEKRHACSQCSFRTHFLNDLKRHMVSHSDEKPFSCDECQKKFKTLHHLKAHTMVHMDKKSFSCDECSMTFKRKPDFHKHLKRHSVDNRYACTKCPFTFPSLHGLKVHSSVHTDERKYSCEHCVAKFSRKDYLKGHLMVHMREKPHACLQKTFC